MGFTGGLYKPLRGPKKVIVTPQVEQSEKTWITLIDCRLVSVFVSSRDERIGKSSDHLCVLVG